MDRIVFPCSRLYASTFLVTAIGKRHPWLSVIGCTPGLAILSLIAFPLQKSALSHAQDFRFTACDFDFNFAVKFFRLEFSQ